MTKYPMKHLCTCNPEDNHGQEIYYERVINGANTSFPFKATLLYEDCFPVLVCSGCNKEFMLDKDNWYSNWVREGEHFTNDLHILLETLAHYMQLADKDGKLEYKGITFSNTMEKLE